MNGDTVRTVVLNIDENGITCLSMNLRPWEPTVYSKNGGIGTQLCHINLLHLQIIYKN